MHFPLLDFLLENRLEFEVVETYSALDLLDRLFPKKTVPSADDLRNRILPLRSAKYFSITKDYIFNNVIFIYTTTIRHCNADLIMATSFAVTSDNQKIYLKHIYFRPETFHTTFRSFTKKSVIYMHDNYSKVVNFIIYQSALNCFLPVQEQISKTVDGSSFDSFYFNIPCFSTLSDYLKNECLDSLDISEEETQELTEIINNLFSELKSLNLSDATEKLLFYLVNKFPTSILQDAVLYKYLTIVSLAANFINHNYRGESFPDKNQFYEKLTDVFLTLGNDCFDLFSCYNCKIEPFKYHLHRFSNPDAILFWKTAQIVPNATASLKEFCDFCIDLLKLPSMIQTNFDFNLLLEYTFQPLADDFMHLYARFVTRKAIFYENFESSLE